MILVWLRTGSNPADINRFQSHTGKNVFFVAKTVFCGICFIHSILKRVQRFPSKYEPQKVEAEGKRKAPIFTMVMGAKIPN